MSVHAGTILHIGGKNIIDRIQSAGLGDTRVPVETIREVGNREVVDKVQGEADFTFTVESFDVSTEFEAWLTGKVGAGSGSAQAPGAADADGTEYSWLDCKHVNITSPWKDGDTGSAGTVTAGHIIPGYYPTRIRYRFGVTDSAAQEVELAGGSFYYGDFAPVEEYFAGDGVDTTFVTGSGAIGHRVGGAGGTTFKRIFGVLVNGTPQTEGIDYTESGPEDASSQDVTVTFATAPPAAADIRITYFTDDAQAWPQTLHPAAAVKPGAVRGRNICVYLGSGGTRVKLGGVQAAELEATVDGEIEREFCNEEPVGRRIDGTDVTGSVTVRSKNAAAFFDLLAKVTGVAKTEIYGYLNNNDIPLTIQIQNPKDPAAILKTLYVSDAIFQIPGTPARVNTPTDFEFRFESRSGKYSAYKGSFLP